MKALHYPYFHSKFPNKVRGSPFKTQKPSQVSAHKKRREATTYDHFSPFTQGHPLHFSIDLAWKPILPLSAITF